jgi:cytochrome c-type biogenesis protein CcmE
LKKKYIYGAAILVLAAAYLIYLSLNSSISYYLTVSEFFDKGTELYETSVRIAGKISEPVEWDADSVKLTFIVTEGNSDMTVVYDGVRPSGFKADSSILVEGKYGSDGVFRASQLIMKCPSKYELEE